MAVGVPAPSQAGKELPEGQETWLAGEGFPRRGGSGVLAFKLCHPCRWHVLRVAAARPPRQGYGNQASKKKKNHNKYREGLTKLRASFPKPHCSSPGSPVSQAACESVSRFAEAGARPRSQIKYCACRSRARQVFLGSDLPAAASLQERLKRP